MKSLFRELAHGYVGNTCRERYDWALIFSQFKRCIALLKIFIHIHTFSPFVNMNTVHTHKQTCNYTYTQKRTYNIFSINNKSRILVKVSGYAYHNNANKVSLESLDSIEHFPPSPPPPVTNTKLSMAYWTYRHSKAY